MPPDFMSSIGKGIFLVGVLLAVVGAVLMLAGRHPSSLNGLGWLGRLPGDLLIKRDSFTFYFPLATSILISIVLTLLIYVITSLRR
jgi:hypothetical protein